MTPRLRRKFCNEQCYDTRANYRYKNNKDAPRTWRSIAVRARLFNGPSSRDLISDRGIRKICNAQTKQSDENALAFVKSPPLRKQHKRGSADQSRYQGSEEKVQRRNSGLSK